MATTRFEIKLNPFLRASLEFRAKRRGLPLAGYIQELCWRECPEAEREIKAICDAGDAELLMGEGLVH